MKLAYMVVAAALLTLPILALSRAPYTPAGAGEAVLRYSWRMNVSAREECRPRTQQELEELPVHMRTPEVCTRDRASYMLVTGVDAASPDTVELLRGGAKGDRPLFVIEERRLTPGLHRVRVQLIRSTAAAEPAVLASLDTVLMLEAGNVQLVTIADDTGDLTVRSSAAR